MRFAACVGVLTVLALSVATAQELDPVEACRSELRRESAGIALPQPLMDNIISSAMSARPGLSCLTYARIIQTATVAVNGYLNRPPRGNESAHQAARNGRLSEARAAYSDLGAAPARERNADLHDAYLLSLAMSDFKEAARLAGLAAHTADLDQRTRQIYREAQAQALLYSGDYLEDVADLDPAALAIYRELSIAIGRDDERWASIQANLANGVFTQAERTSDPERRLSLLVNAVALYRAVSEERRRFPQPNDWARTQYNLGRALVEVGARRGAAGRSDLEAALAAHRNALAVYSPEDSPQLWAKAQMGAAATLMVLSVMERNTEARIDALREPIALLETALAVRTREAAPFDSAAISDCNRQGEFGARTAYARPDTSPALAPDGRGVGTLRSASSHLRIHAN